MRYLFGDSTDFLLQRDFLKLLDSFIDTSVRAISLDNAVFNMKQTIIDRRRLNDSVVDEMDTFQLMVEDAISSAVASSKEETVIIEYAEKSKDFLKKLIEEGKNKLSDEIIQEIALIEKKIEERDEENRKVIEAFFIQDPVRIINSKYNVKATSEGYSAKVQLDCEGNISCVFELASSEIPFWDGYVKAFDFVRDVEIPARMKKPFLRKEEVPDIVSMNDYFLGDLELSGKELEVVFNKRLEAGAERFRLKMNFTEEFTVESYHAEENEEEMDIQSVPELKREINFLKLRELGEKILEQTNNLYAKKQRLEHIYLNGTDVIDGNIVFELMQKVAEIFAPTIDEIKKHSPFEEELSLKVEDESRKRSENYIIKSDVRDKLNALNEKGGKLLDSLGIG